MGLWVVEDNRLGDAAAAMRGGGTDAPRKARQVVKEMHPLG